MFSDIVKKNMCVNIHDRRSIGVARSEARDMHIHLRGNKGIQYRLCQYMPVIDYTKGGHTI